jgi:hypothetical protein
MKRLTRTLPLFLAAALQLLPLLRNIVISPAASSSFAIILRWGIGSTAALGAYDAYSAASNYFTSPTNFTGTANLFFTNKLTILSSQGDGQALCTITTNGVAAAVLSNGQTTTVGMPKGLTFKFFDPNSGVQGSLYCSIYGTVTNACTNVFHVDMSRAGSTSIPGDFTIKILASASLAPVITNQPAGLTNNIGTSASFNVIAGSAPLNYQWYFNTNTALLNQTNASLTVTNIQLTNAGMYSVTITNSAGTTNSTFAALTVWQPPVITNQPASFTSVAGGAVTFSVTAGGTPAPAYQWKFNTNTALIGATGNTLPLANLRASQTGVYSVTVTNAAGATNSFFALLTVTNPPPPVIAGAIGTGGAFQFTFTPVAGLTNTILTNGILGGTNWGVFTNLPPAAGATPITFSNLAGNPNLFYRVMIQP